MRCFCVFAIGMYECLIISSKTMSKTLTDIRDNKTFGQSKFAIWIFFLVMKKWLYVILSSVVPKIKLSISTKTTNVE